MTRRLPSISDLVPHRGRSIFVEAVVELRADGLECRARIPPEHALARNGFAPTFVGLEAAAQAAAAWEALRVAQDESRRTPPRVGYLVKVGNVRAATPMLPVDTPLTVAIEADGGAGTLSLYRVRVALRGEAVLDGTIGTYVRGSGAPP